MKLSPSSAQLALYQPDIPQNLGSILRLCACMGAALHIIEPCGFVLEDKKLKRVAMDYIALAQYERHASWEVFSHWRRQDQRRLILLTTKTTHSLYDFRFMPHDILLLGRESAGVPPEVTEAADACVTIPMLPTARSLNVSLSAAMALGEAYRQLHHHD